MSAQLPAVGATVRVTRLKGRASDRIPFLGTVRTERGSLGGELLVVDPGEQDCLTLVIARDGELRTDLRIEAVR
jgi:hypothetical protein